MCDGEYYWILPGIFHLQKILEDQQKILCPNKIVPLYIVSIIVCHMSNLKKEKKKKKKRLVTYRDWWIIEQHTHWNKDFYLTMFIPK